MKINRSERGQSLVEFAISLVVILFLLAGAVEFGLALFQYIQLRDAAQEGAVYGSICPRDPAKIETRVRAHSSSPVDLSVTSGSEAVTVNVKGIDSTTATGPQCTTAKPKDFKLLEPGDGICVEVSFNHQVFMPFGTLFTRGSNTILIQASVTNTILNNDMSKLACQ